MGIPVALVALQGLFGFTTLSFAPYVVFAYVNIAVSIICAVAGIFIFKAVPGNDAEAVWKIRGGSQGSSPTLEPEPSLCAEAAVLMEESAAALASLSSQT